jgi:hypothetical protein
MKRVGSAAVLGGLGRGSGRPPGSRQDAGATVQIEALRYEAGG